MLAWVAAVSALPVALAGQAPLTDAQLFDDSVLQRIELQVSARDWDTLRANYTKNTFYPATMVWRGQSVQNVGIRSRGSGTRSPTKPGILVDFDKYVTGQTFLGLKALVLDNHLQDPSAMREAIAMTVLARLGLPAPREAPVELYINGAFFGLYTLVENIDSVATRRLFPATTAARGAAAATFGHFRPVAREPRQTPPPQPPAPVPTVPAPSPTPDPPVTPPSDPPPGYLFEYKWLDYFYETYLGFDLDPYVGILEAKTHEDDPTETLYRPIEQLFREINAPVIDGFAERVGAWLDLPLYVQLVAVQSYLAEWDGIAGSFGANNFYLFRPEAGGPHKVIPWDEDNTFHEIERDVDIAQRDHVLMERAMRDPNLRSMYVSTLNRVMALTEERPTPESATWLEREILRRDALKRARSRDDRVKPYTDADVEAAVAFNLEFARKRAAIVRQQLSGRR
jgi:hypothetical protein